MSSAAGALASSGPVILLGDFNTHLSANNDRSELLLQVVQECHLYSVSTSSIANGPIKLQVFLWRAEDKD